MKFINIHTHHPASENDEIAIVDISSETQPDFSTLAYSSYGINPWFLTQENVEGRLKKIEFFLQQNVLTAIGEVGFDLIHGADIHLQEAIFNRIVSLSESFKKPLIIHCVKAWDLLLKIRKNNKISHPWIIHGFHGSRELAWQLIKKDLLLSFGIKLLHDIHLRNVFSEIPLERLFLETDDNPMKIYSLYQSAAFAKSIDIQYLKKNLFINFTTLF